LGCASRGSGPQGGPKDTTPPLLLKCSPENGATNVSTNKIHLTFDEIVLVQNTFEKVIISPPQSQMAIIKASGHKVNVEFQDSLKENTTYTIDFTNSIVDNNEKNELKDFTFSFATGDFIDTLKLSGTVIDAETLNPIPNLMVGIHSNLNDSAFTSIPFDRISKTNSDGKFTINNIKAGEYHVFALSDIGNNYYFDIPTEQIAFNDSIYAPICTTEITYDTISHYAIIDTINNLVDSTQLIIDSITTKYNYTYTPDDVVLLAFTEVNNRQYLVKSERPEPHKIILFFGNSCDTLPSLKPLNIEDSLFEYILQTSYKNDTLTYWLTDTTSWKQDTIQVETKYQKREDSTYWQTDTISFIYKAPKSNKKKQEIEEPIFHTIKHNASSSFDVYIPLTISFDSPTSLNITDSINYQLQEKIDTNWIDINTNLIKADSIGLSYHIFHEWKPSTEYQLILDSALFISFTELASKEEKITLKTKSLEEYSILILELSQHTGKEIVQLLNKEDIVIHQKLATEPKLKFEYIKPDTYYVRLFIDENDNGKWDTGNYKEHIKPEKVYYYPYDIELRAFWDVEEIWDINTTPLLEQKPSELIKTTKK
jgi:uncharacterized protein (DUF2141 family)